MSGLWTKEWRFCTWRTQTCRGIRGKGKGWGLELGVHVGEDMTSGSGSGICRVGRGVDGRRAARVTISGDNGDDDQQQRPSTKGICTYERLSI